jgi:ABC-type oligopeptide transport system ATPase subunit
MLKVSEDGLPWKSKHAGLLKSIEEVKERVFDVNKAAMIIIDGGVGSGKTTLAVHIADYINGGPISFEDQLAMGGDDFSLKLRECYTKGLKVVIYDEAGDFNRRASLTRANAELNRVFDTFRVFKIIVILILPTFYELDDSILKKEIARFLIHCHGRTKTQGYFQAFSLFRAYYIRRKMKELVVTPQAYEKQGNNLQGSFRDLPNDRKKELDAYSVQGKLEILDKKAAKKEGFVTAGDVSHDLRCSIHTVYSYLRKYRLKEVKVIGSTKYYNSDLIDKIRPLTLR